MVDRPSGPGRTRRDRSMAPSGAPSVYHPVISTPNESECHGKLCDPSDHPGHPDPVRDLDPHLRDRPAGPRQPRRPLPRAQRCRRSRSRRSSACMASTSRSSSSTSAWITAFVQVWRVDAWGFSFIDGRPVLSQHHGATAGDPPADGHRAGRDHHLQRPDRHPRRRQAVQLDGQDHHLVRDDRLRHPVVPAGHLRLVPRRDRPA